MSEVWGDAAPPAVTTAEVVGRPRTWTPFVTVALGFLLGMIAVLAIAVTAGVALTVAGRSPGEIERFLASDAIGIILLLAPVQAGIFVAAVAHAWFSAQREASGSPPIVETLGLRWPARLGVGGWTAILIGSGVPFALALGAAALLPSVAPPTEIMEMWGEVPAWKAVLWIAAIGLLPGACEELIFRGLLQRRLLRRWSPPVAIGVTSVLFALVHVDPQAMGLALVLGVWIGVVAWRTNSVFPGMVIHAGVNSTWNAIQIIGIQNNIDDMDAMRFAAVVVLVSLVAFPFAIVTLIRAPHPGPGREGRGVGDAA